MPYWSKDIWKWDSPAFQHMSPKLYSNYFFQLSEDTSVLETDGQAKSCLSERLSTASGKPDPPRALQGLEGIEIKDQGLFPDCLISQSAPEATGSCLVQFRFQHLRSSSLQKSKAGNFWRGQRKDTSTYGSFLTLTDGSEERRKRKLHSDGSRSHLQYKATIPAGGECGTRVRGWGKPEKP